MIALSEGALDFTAEGLEDGEYVIVDALEAPTARYGSATIAENEYTVTSEAEEIKEIKLGAEDATLTANLEVTVTTESSSATYKINEDAYTAAESALSIDVTAEGSTLMNGAVTVVDNVAVGEDADVVTVSDDEDGVVVAVEEGTVTSITGLTDAGNVVFNGATYEMYGSVLKVTDAEGIALYDGSGEETNLLDLGDINLVYIQIDSNTNALDLAYGVKDLSDGVRIIYGTESPAEFKGDYIIELEEVDGAYALKAVEGAELPEGLSIDASEVEGDDVAVTTDFATQVVTAEGAKIAVNGNKYAAAEGGLLTIDATAEGSTLFAGTVVLDADDEDTASVSVTAYAEGSIAAVSGSVTLTAVNGEATEVGDLNNGESFRIGNADAENSAIFTKAAIGIVKVDAEENRTVWTGSTGNTASVDDLISEDTVWQEMAALIEGAVVLTTLTEDGTALIVDDVTEPSASFGTVIKDGTAYTVTPAFADSITEVVLGAGEDGTASLTVASAVTVTTTTVDAVYTINRVSYTALSELTIETTARSSALASGTVTVTDSLTTTAEENNTVDVTGDEDGITVEVENGVVTSISDLEPGVTVTFQGNTYKMFENEILQVTDEDGNSVLYSGMNDESNILETGEAITYIAIEEDNVLDLGTGVAALEIGRVIYGTDETYSGDYNFELTDSDAYVLTLVGEEVADLTIDASAIANGSVIKTDFAAKLVTAEGASLTVNGPSYGATADSALTIDATPDSSTLYSGTIEGIASASTTNGDTVIVESETDDFKVTAVDGAMTTIADINVGETIIFNDVTYYMAAAGLIKEGSAVWVGNEIADGGEVSVEALTDADNWQAVVEAAQGALTLSAETEVPEGGALVVDSVEAPTTKYGTLTATENGFSLTAEGADEDAKLAAVSVEGVVAEFADDFAGVPVVAGGAEFVITKAVDTFTVYNVTEEYPANVVGADGVAVMSGSVEVGAGTAITDSTGEEELVTVSAGAYTATVTDGTLSVSDVKALDAEITAAGIDVTTVDLNNEAVTYTIGEQTFAIAEDDSEGVTFTIGGDGNVTAISGLDAGATLRIGGLAEGDTITINDHEFTVAEDTLDEDGLMAVVGIQSGTDAMLLATGQSYLLQINSDGTMSIFTIADDGTISDEPIDPEVVNPDTGKLFVDEYATFEDGVVKLADGKVPTEGIVVISNQSSSEVAFESSNGTFYADGLTSVQDSDGAELGVRVISGSELLVVSIDGTVAPADEVPASGKIGMNTGMTLTAGDLTVDTALGEGSVEFGEAVTLDGDSMTAEGEFTFVLTADEETVSYTVNDVIYKVVDTATIDAEGTLVDGTLNVAASIVTPEGEVVVTGDEDGVLVTVAEGAVTSISELEVGVSVEFNGSTYTMVSEDQFTVTTEGDTKIYSVADSAEAQNVLEQGESIAYLQAGDEGIDVAAGVEKLADNGSVVYGSGETYNADEVVATLTAGEEEGEYELAAGDGITTPAVVDASGVDGLTALTTDFDAAVTTPASTDPVTVNDSTYTSTGESLTIEANEDGTSALIDGTVALAEGESVAPASDDAVTAVTGDVTVTVAAGDATSVGNIDDGDSFTVGEDTYTKTPYGLVKGENEVVAGSASGTSFNLNTTPELVTIVAVDEDGTLDLTEELEEGTYLLVTSDRTQKIADLTVGDSEYAIASTGAADDALTTISLGSSAAAITTDVPVQVVTAAAEEGTIYTINGDTYVATGDALTIDVTAEGTSLESGRVLIDSSDDTVAPASVTINGKVVTALGTDLKVVAADGTLKTVEDLEPGEMFSVEDEAATEDIEYKYTEAGLLRYVNGELTHVILASDMTVDESGAMVFTVPESGADTDASEWSPAALVDENNALAIDSDTVDGTVYLNSDAADAVAVAQYVANEAGNGGTLNSIDADAAKALTINVTGDLDVEFDEGFAAADSDSTGATVNFTNNNGESWTFELGKVKEGSEHVGVRGSSGASISIDGGEDVTITAADKPVNVAAGTVVTITDDAGNSNTVVATEDYSVGITEDGIPVISGIEDISGISVAGTATVDVIPSVDTSTTYSIGTQEFTTRSKTEGNTLTLTLSGDSVEEGSSSTRVTSIENLEQGAILTVTDSDSSGDDTSVSINGREYDDVSTLTVVGTVTEDGGQSSKRVDNGSYYVFVDESGEAHIYLLNVTGSDFAIDTDTGEIDFSSFSSAEAYDNSGTISMKDDDEAVILPTADNTIIINNQSSTPLTLSSATDNFVEDLMGMAVYVVDTFTLKVMNVEGDTISEVTEIPSAGIVGIPYSMTLEVGSELKIDNTGNDSADVMFGETVTLIGTDLEVTGAADTTFTLGAADTEYKINGLTFTSATDADTVAVADDAITLTTIGDGMTVDGDGTFVLTAGGIYTVNDATFDVVADATIEDGMLVDGTVKIYDTITVNAGEIKLSNDTDGVEVTVANDEVTSITKLTNGGTVEYNGATYEMTSDGRLKITAEGEVKFYDGGEDVNILEPGEATAYEEVAEDGTIALNDEVLAKLAEDGSVEFGTTDSDTGETTPLATLTKDEDGAYTLTSEAGMADATEPFAIDASGVDDMTSLTTDFDAEVTTPEGTEPVKVNDTTYVSADGEPLTVAANADGTSTLSEGTVALDAEGENNAVTPTNDSDSAVAATAGDGITATVDSDGGLAEIGGIDDGDSFKVGDEEYTKAPAGLVSDGKILDDSASLTSADPEALAEEDSWTAMLALTAESELDLTDATLAGEGEVKVVDSVENPTKVYGTATYTEGEVAAYTFSIDSYADEIAAVKLGAADAALTITGANGVVVKTESGNATYTVNGNEYTAVDSELELNAVTGGATLINGTVAVADALATSEDYTLTVSNDESGVVVTVEDGVFTSVTGLTDGGKVELSTGAEFEMIGEVLKYIDVDGGVRLYDGSGETTDLLALGGANLIYIMVDPDTSALDLALGAEDLNDGLRVIYGTETPAAFNGEYLVELSGGENAYTLAKNGEAAVDGLPIDASGIADDSTLTTDFAAQVITAEGATITVNEDKYVAAEGTLTIDAVEGDSTLFNGTVVLAEGESVVPSTGDAIAATAGSVNITVADGIIESFSAIEAGDAFQIGEDEYKMSEIGVINSNNELWLNTETTIFAGALAEGIFNPMVTVDEENAVDVTAIENAAVVVDSIEEPTAVYGLADYDSDTATYTVAGGENTQIAGAKLGAEDTNLVITGIADAFVKTASGSATYTINDVAYTATESELEVIVAEDGSYLNNGAVTVTDTVTVAEEKAVVVADDEDGVVVTVADGAVTSITGLSSVDDEETGEALNGVVTYDGATYEMMGNVLKVTDAEGNVTLYDESGEDTNVLAPETAQITYIPIAEGFALDLTAGMAALENGRVIYGTAEEFDGTYLIELTGEGTYALTAAEGAEIPAGLLISTAGIDDAVALTTDFAAQVLTGEGATVTVNNSNYVAAEGAVLTIDATAEGSTLYAGTVVLAEGESITQTSDSVVTTAFAGTINVTVVEGDAAEVSGLDVDDRFNVTGTFEGVELTIAYYKTSYGLIQMSGSGEDVVAAVNESVDDIFDVANDSGENWANIIQVGEGNKLDLTEVTEGGVITSADFSSKYGNMSLTDGTYDIVSVEGATEAITVIQIGTENTGVRVDFDSRIQTAEGEMVEYNVNDVTYVATSGALTIGATAESSTLITGLVHLDSTGATAPESVVVGEDTITATGTELDVAAEEGAAQYVADIDEGETFTVNDDTYQQTAAGLIKNGNQIINADVDGTWTANDYTYNFDNEFELKDVVVLGEDNAVEITSDTADGTVFVDSDMSEVVATYEDGTVKAGENAAPSQVTIADEVGEVGFEGIGDDTKIVSGGSEFSATPSDATEGFKVNGNRVSGISGASITDGEVEVADEGVTTNVKDSDGNVVASFTPATGTYTAAVDPETGGLAITDAEGTNFDVTGPATIATTPIADDTQYTIGDQTFDFTGDTNGVTFTTDSDGTVTGISDLEAGSQVTFESDEPVSVNGVEFESGDVVEGTENGNAIKLRNESYYIVFNGSAISVYEFDSDTGVIDTDARADISDVVTSGNDTTVVLHEEVAPNKVVIANQSDETVGLTKNGIIYVAGVSNATVKVELTALTLAEVADGAIASAEELPTVGSVTIKEDSKLIAAGLEIGKGAVTFAEDGVALRLDAMEVTGATNETFKLVSGGTATINELVFTAAAETDTVTFGEEAVTLKTASVEDAMAVTGEGTFKLASTGAYSVNGTAYNVIEEATIVDNKLDAGTVAVMNSVEITGDKVVTIPEANTDADGAVVTVEAGGNITIIKNLDAGAVVEYEGETYTMYEDGTIAVTAEGVIGKVYKGKDSDTNILDLADEEYTAYVEVDSDTNEISVAEGVAALADEKAAAVEYGYGGGDAPIATMKQAEDGTYELTSEPALADAETPTVDATGVDALTTDFDAKVKVPAGQETEVNGTKYDAVGDVTVAANADGTSTLDDGTVNLEDGESVTPTDGEAIAAGEGSAITVGVDPEEGTSIGGIEEGDKFSVGDDNYEAAAAGILQVDENGEPTALLDTTDTSTFAPAAEKTWTPTDSLAEADSPIDLSGIAEDTAVLTPDKKLAATVDVDNTTEPPTYDVKKGDGLAEEPVVALGEENANVTTDFPATVTTPENGGTYGVNGKNFSAQSPLEIATNPDGETTLTDGAVELANGESVKTTGGEEITAGDNSTITADVDSETGAVAVSGIDEGESFKIGDDEYTRTPLGIMKGDELLAGSEGAETYTPAEEEQWNTTEPLNESGVVAIDSDTEDGVTFINADGTGVAAEYNDGVLTAGEDASDIKNIDVAGKPLEIKGFDSDTEITSGDTKFTANDEDADFTVDPTTEPAKVDNAGEINLTEGAVTVDGTDTAVNAAGNTITPAEGTELVVDSDGTISGIADGESFKVGDDTFTKDGENLFKTDSDGTVTLVADAVGDTFDPSSYEESEFITLDAEGKLDLTVDANKKNGAIVFDNATQTRVATLAVEGAAYTVTAIDAASIAGVKLGAEDATLTVDFETTVETAEGANTYVVNGVTYVATASALEIAATADSSTLFAGTVHLDSTGENAPASVVIGTKTITATGTEIDVNAAGGEAVSIADIDGFTGSENESFTITDGDTTDSYEQTGVGLIKNGEQLLENSAVEDFTYNLSDDNWKKMEVLTEEGKVALTEETEDTIYVNPDKTGVAAEYADGTLTAGDAADEIQSIEVADEPATIAGFDSDTTIKSGDTVFKANDDNFTVTPATEEEPVKVDAEEVTLEEGTVAVEPGTTVNAGDVEVKPTEGDGITVSADGTIGGLNDGDKFTVGEEEYEMTPIGLKDSEGNVYEAATDGTVTPAELADTDAKIAMVAIDAEGYVALADVEGEVVVVDNVEDPQAKYGTIAKADDAFTVDSDDETFKGVKTEGSATINGVEFVTDGALTVNVTDEATTLYAGTVVVAEEFTALADGGIAVENDEDGVIVKVEDGVVTSITDLDAGGKVTYGDTTFTMDENGTLTVTEGDATLVYNGQSDATNLLDLSGAVSSAYVQVDPNEAIDLAAGIAALEAGADEVVYGNSADPSDSDAVVATLTKPDSDTTEYALTADDGTAVDASGLGEGEAITFTPGEGDKGIEVDGTTYKGDGEVTLNGKDGGGVGSADLGDGIEVTGADDEQVFNLDPKAAASINGQNFANTGKTPVEGVVKTDDGFVVGDKATVDVYPAAAEYTVEAKADSDGVITDVAITGVPDGASIDGAGTFDVVTDGNGTVTIGEDPYTVADSDGVTFAIADGALASIGGVDGTVAGNFEDGVTINREGNEVKIGGDDDETATVEAAGKKVNAISGVGGEEVTIDNVGGARALSTSGEDGTYTFTKGNEDAADDQVFTISDDEDGVTFALDRDGNVTGIEDLDGSVEIASDGPIAINGDKLTLGGVEDAVTISADSDTGITTVDGLQGAINGLENALVNAVDSDVTVNGTPIVIDEGDGAAEFVVAVDSDGKVAGVMGVNDGAAITSAPKMEVATAEEGTFTFGNIDPETGELDTDTAVTYTIDGDEAVVFQTDKNSDVTNINGLSSDGTLTSSENALTVNGAAVAFDTTDSDTEVSIVGGENGVSSIVGLGSGDSVTAPSGAAVAMPGADSVPSTLTVNDTPFILDGDDGVVITGNSVTGLDDNASLTVGAAGTYTFASDDDTQTLTLDINDVVLVDKDGGISVYDPTDYNLDGDSTTDQIIRQLTNNPTGNIDRDYTNDGASAIVSVPEDGETVEGTEYYDPSETYNGNLVFDLSDKEIDLSDGTGKKKVTLEEGDQTLTFNDDGGNIAIVGEEARGDKVINLGDGGDIAVIEDTPAEVTVAAGAGEDQIVSKSDNLVVTTANGGKTKVTPLGNDDSDTTITFADYDDEDYEAGTGVQTSIGDIARAIKNNTIILGDGKASIDGEGEVVFNPDATEEGATKANFYNSQGDVTKIGFTHSAGGEVDMSDETAAVVMKGNYGEGRPSDKAKTGGSELTGGSGNDTVFAGGNDTVDAGAGYNTIDLTPAANRKISDDGAVVSMTNATGKNVVEGFNNNGFDHDADKVQYDPSKVATLDDIGITFDGENLTVKVGRASTELKDVTAETDSDGEVSYATLALQGAGEGKAEPYKAAIAEAGKDIAVTDDEEQMAQYYFGDKSGVDFSKTDGELAVNLGGEYKGESYGMANAYNGDALYFKGINEVAAGSGQTTLIGAADENNTLIAGTGANSIWGGGASNDLLVGAAGNENKDDSTEFFFLAGDGKDTITNFEYVTPDGYNTNADKISTGETAVDKVQVDGSDVIITLATGTDRLRIEGAAGKDFQIENNFDTVTAQVNETELTYDGAADYFVATGKNAKLTVVEDSDNNAEIWLNNDPRGTDAQFHGDIKTVDASAFTGNATLVGNDNNNVLIGGSGNNSLWGGSHGDDSLVGGDGDDLFWYELGNGNDTISNVGDNDTINLFGVSLDDFAVTGEALFDGNNVVAKFKNGDTLTIENGKNSSATYTYGGTSWAVENGKWVQK